MDIEKQLPVYTKLDIEFSKNADMIYDLFVTTLKKRLNLCELLIDDLNHFVKQKIKTKSGWSIDKNVEVWGDIAPKALRNKPEFSDFGSGFADDEHGFLLNLFISRKTKKPQGFIVQIMLTLNTVIWYVGQFGMFEKSQELFSYNDYKKIEESLVTKGNNKTLYAIDLSYPGTVDAYNDSEKFIGILLDFKKVKCNKEIISVHDTFKSQVLTQLFAKLKNKSE